MKTKYKELFAIFKSGKHLGNERGASPDEALRNYLRGAKLGEYLNDKEFIIQYTMVIAIKGVHYGEYVTNQRL